MEVFLIAVLIAAALFIIGSAISKRLFRSSFVSLAKVQEQVLRRLASEIPLRSSARFPMRAGEGFVYQLDDVSLVEPRRGTRTSTRSTHAITFAVAKGLYYTAGSSKGESPEPDDELKVIDQGTATFTSKRIVFAGSKQSREWAFSKILGWEDGEGTLLTIAVSNRQKVSGIRLNSLDDLMPSVALQISLAVNEGGWSEARSLCSHGAENARKQAEFVAKNPNAGEAEINRFVAALEQSPELVDIQSEFRPATDARSDAKPEKPKNFSSDVVEMAVESRYGSVLADLRSELAVDDEGERVVKATLTAERELAGSRTISVYILDRKIGSLAVGASELAARVDRLNRDVEVRAEILFGARDQDEPAATVLLSLADSTGN